MSRETRTDTELQRIERMILLSQGLILRTIHNAKENIMSLIDDATASTAAKVSKLAAEVATANAKTDAALAALATAVSTGQLPTQAQIDAINAIGAAADDASSQLQAEEAKVDAALAPAAGGSVGDTSAT